VHAEQPDLETVKKRLLYVQAMEAARCFEEGVVTEPTTTVRAARSRSLSDDANQSPQGAVRVAQTRDGFTRQIHRAFML
jgi:hypothetical protein